MVTYAGHAVIVYSTVLYTVEVAHGAEAVVVRTDEVFFPTGQLVTSGGQEVIVYSTVERTVDVDQTGAVMDGVGVSVAVTGQMVVPTLMISVVTDPFLAGQSVTVAAHEVIV